MEQAMNINRWTRNKVIIENVVFFAGGYPKFRWFPKVIGGCGTYAMIFWLGTELWIRRKMAKSPREAGLEPLTNLQWQALRSGFLLWSWIDAVIDFIDIRKEDFQFKRK
jgi:hypothetical protein